MSINIHLIRHGESEYNIDQNTRLDILDWDVKLTDIGIGQVNNTSEKLKDIIYFDDINVEHSFFVSPFRRTMQTFEIIESSIDFKTYNLKYEPLITEQRTPVYYGKILKLLYDEFMDLNPYNRFWARYLDFETGFEVYQRACMFKNILRDVISMSKNTHEINIYVISHGFFIRTLRMSILNYSITEFVQLKNPYYAELLTLTAPHMDICYDQFPQFNTLFSIKDYSI